MLNKLILKIKNKSYLGDTFFLLLLFGISLYTRLLFNLKTPDTVPYFIMIISVWSMYRASYSMTTLTKISLFDLGVGLFIGYLLFHFNRYSDASYLDPKLWVYTSYFVLFYMFRWLLTSINKLNFFFHFVLVLIVILGVLQSVIGILQYVEILNSKNEHFKLVGSFTSPNFFGAYLGLGLSILVWYLFIKKIKRKSTAVLSVFCIMLFTTLIVLSNSRTTWLAFIGVLFVFICTSKKTTFLLNKLSATKKSFGFLLLLLISFGAGIFLYSLKPESVNGRILVAKISLLEIEKKPILGHGLRSFARDYNKAKALYFMSENRSWDELKIGSYVYTPFNDFLLIAFELGIIVLLFLIVLLFVTIVKVEINIKTRIGLALLINLCIQALFTSPSSAISLMLIGIFGCALLIKFGNFNMYFIKLPMKSNTSLRVTIFIISCIGISLSYSTYVNKNKLQTFYVTQIGSLNKNTLNSFSKEVEKRKSSESYFHLGTILYKLEKKQEGLAYMEKSFEMTSAPKVGKALASYYLKEKNYKRAEEIYRFNIAVEPYRYEARMDLLSLLKKCNQYKEIVFLSQEIIDFPTKIASEKVADYKRKATKSRDYYSKFINPNFSLKGSLSNAKIFKSQLLNKKLPYKVYLPPIIKITKKLPVIYINDGYSYIKKGNLPKVLDSLINNNIINPIVVVFLEPIDKNNNWKNIRQELFLCNPTFVEFFTKEFMPRIEKTHPVSSERKDRTIMGVSFGGLAAAYIAKSAPNLFKNIIMQSPAFHSCENIYKSYAKGKKEGFKIYLSYGTGKDTEKQDIPMIKILKQKHYELKVERVEGGNHSWSIWKNQLNDIFIYLFKINSQGTMFIN